MEPFLTCSPLPHRLHRSPIAPLRRPSHRRRIWAIYAALKPCLLGARRDEVGGMSWSELSSGGTVWTLPGSRTKTGQARELPLPRQAVEILAAVPNIAGQPHLFGRNGFQAWS